MCDKRSNLVCCSIIPPHILRHIAEKGNALQKDLAFRALSLSAQLRGQRQVLNTITFLAATPTGDMRRNVYDAQKGMTLPGNLVRAEGQAATGDTACDEAYDSAGKTYDFYNQVFQRKSLDNRGLRLDSTAHYGSGYNNAFWNGQQMIYGDGDGTLFTRFTVSVDVIAHELTHGITQHEANLVYQGQPGALNEHLSDVFGSLVKQFVNGQAAADADWLIGQGLLMPSISGVALRSLKAPGTAYDDATLGTDPQPDHMNKYVDTEDDNGGVHINSGIPNKAFYSLAVSLGGNAWEQAGHIWYSALIHELAPNDTFQDCANKTWKVARDLYGGDVADKVRAAWQIVGLGVVTAGVAGAAAQPSAAATSVAPGTKVAAPSGAAAGGATAGGAAARGSAVPGAARPPQVGTAAAARRPSGTTSMDRAQAPGQPKKTASGPPSKQPATTKPANPPVAKPASTKPAGARPAAKPAGLKPPRKKPASSQRSTAAPSSARRSGPRPRPSGPRSGAPRRRPGAR